MRKIILGVVILLGGVSVAEHLMRGLPTGNSAYELGAKFGVAFAALLFLVAMITMMKESVGTAIVLAVVALAGGGVLGYYERPDPNDSCILVRKNEVEEVFGRPVVRVARAEGEEAQGPESGSNTICDYVFQDQPAIHLVLWINRPCSWPERESQMQRYQDSFSVSDVGEHAIEVNSKLWAAHGDACFGVFYVNGASHNNASELLPERKRIAQLAISRYRQ